MIEDEDTIDMSDFDDLKLDLGEHGVIFLNPDIMKDSDRSMSSSLRSRAHTEITGGNSSFQEPISLKLPGYQTKSEASSNFSINSDIKFRSKHLSGSDLKRIMEETKSKTDTLIKQQQKQNQKFKEKLIKCGMLSQEIDKTKANGGKEALAFDVMSELAAVLKEKPNAATKYKGKKVLTQKKLSDEGPCTHLPDPSQPLPPLPPKPREFRTSDVDRCLEILKAGEILPLHTVKFVCAKLSEHLVKESNVRNIASPVTVVGDIHGQFYDLMEMFRIGGEAPTTNYLFLGDYVDRGHYSVETFSYLACIKLRYPDRVTLIRGNHESRMTTTSYGFRTECQEKYGTQDAWHYFTNMFDYLPVAATIDGEIFATHGGLSPTLHTIDAVRVIFRFREIPENGPFCDLMWADPDPDGPGFKVSSRMASYTFGKDVFDKFMHLNKLSFMFRAHQLCHTGYQLLWGNFATVWSAPNYCYRCGNKAAICEVSDGCRSKHFNVYTAAPSLERPVRSDKKKEPRATHFDI